MARRGRIAVAVVAAAALVIGGCTSDESGRGDDRGGSSERSTTPATSTTEAVEPEVQETPGWDLAVGAVGEVPEPPLGSAAGEPLVLDHGFVLYGGTVPPPGVEPTAPQIFDPVDGSWTVVPPDPFEIPLYRPQLMAVPGGFVELGQECTHESPDVTEVSGIAACTPGTLRLARYDRDDGTWEELPVADELQSDEVTVGQAVTLLAADRVTGNLLVHLRADDWLLDAADGTWQRLDEQPSGDDALGFGVCATDAGLASAAAQRFRSDPRTPKDRSDLRVALLAADGTWEELVSDLPAAPLATDLSSFCTDTSVVFVAGPLLAPSDVGTEFEAAFEVDVASGRWREVEVPPAGVDLLGTSVVDGGALAYGTDRAVRYASETGTWEELDVDLAAVAGFASDRDGVVVARPFVDGGRIDDTLSIVRVS